MQTFKLLSDEEPLTVVLAEAEKSSPFDQLNELALNHGSFRGSTEKMKNIIYCLGNLLRDLVFEKLPEKLIIAEIKA
jgi:hypothetical protein